VGKGVSYTSRKVCDDGEATQTYSFGRLFLISRVIMPERKCITVRKVSKKMSAEEFGVVKWFDSKKGFGFIQRDGGEGDIFVHYSAIEGPRPANLYEGDKVAFTIGEGRKGPAAQNVRKVESFD
jgi:CspA family cold shock protein